MADDGRGGEREEQHAVDGPAVDGGLGDFGEKNAPFADPLEEVNLGHPEAVVAGITPQCQPSKSNENKRKEGFVGIEKSIEKSVNTTSNIRPRSQCDGGTKQLKLKNNSKGPASNDVVKERALERVKQKIGEDKFKDLNKRWSSVHAQKNKTKSELQSEGDGMIKTLLGLGFSKVEVMTFLGVGGPRVNRIMKDKPESEEAVRKPPAHAATEEDIKRVLDHITSLDLEPGYPCSHRKIPLYIVGREQGYSWRQIHTDYEDKCKVDKVRVLSCNRFREYVQHFLPSIQLRKTQTDMCNQCYTMGLQLKNPEVSEEEKNELRLKLTVHMDEANIQRRAMNAYIAAVKNKLAPRDPPLQFEPCFIPEVNDEIISEALGMFEGEKNPSLVGHESESNSTEEEEHDQHVEDVFDIDSASNVDIEEHGTDNDCAEMEEDHRRSSNTCLVLHTVWEPHVPASSDVALVTGQTDTSVTAVSGLSAATSVSGLSASTSVSWLSAAISVSGLAAATSVSGLAAAASVSGLAAATSVSGLAEATSVSGLSAATAVPGLSADEENVEDVNHNNLKTVKLLTEKTKDALVKKINSRTVAKREEFAKTIDSNIVSKLQVEIEDFGQEKLLPSFRLRRPGADYFNSSLNVRNMNFISCSPGSQSKMYLYDERNGGKGGDEVCSLRWNHLKLSMKSSSENNIPIPLYHVAVLDNCSGQNKSNTSLKFEAMLSLLGIFKTRTKLYLKPGHSHNQSDVITGECARFLKMKDLFTIEQMAMEMNASKNVNVSVFDSETFFHWEHFLNKYFKDLPVGFSKYYCFEFSEGVMAMKKLCTESSEEEQVVKELIKDPENARREILKELFNLPVDASREVILSSQLRLPRMQKKEVKPSKLESLSKKYSCIPSEFLSYYPGGEEFQREKSGDKKDDINVEMPGLVGLKPKKRGPKPPVLKTSKNTQSIIRFLCMPKIPVQSSDLSQKSSLGSGTVQPSTSATLLKNVKRKTTGLLIDDSEVDENENLTGIC